MTAIQTPQAPPLETIAFDGLGGSFRGELLLPTSPGYDTPAGFERPTAIRSTGDSPRSRPSTDPDNAFHHNKDVQPG